MKENQQTPELPYDAFGMTREGNPLPTIHVPHTHLEMDVTPPKVWRNEKAYGSPFDPY